MKKEEKKPVKSAEKEELKKTSRTKKSSPKKDDHIEVVEVNGQEESKKPRKKFTTIGVYSEEILNEFSKIKTDKQVVNDQLREMNLHKTDGDVLWGTVIGIKPFNEGKNDAFFVIVDFDGIEVLIAESLYFPKYTKFGLGYLNLDDRQKANWRASIIRSSVNAWCPFVLTGVYKKKLDEVYDNSSVVWCLASRVDALDIIQDTYFFHKNRKIKDIEPRNVEVGSVIEAHVLTVKEDLVTVEALGVEAKLDSYSLSDEFIDDCHDKYYSGRVLNLYVKEISTDPDTGALKLKLSGRTNEVSKQISLMKPGCIYLGRVVKYSPQSGNYTFALGNGVRAIVHKSRVEGEVDMVYGDKATIYVTNMFTDHVEGNAIKIR